MNRTTLLERKVASSVGRSDGVAVGRAAWGLFALLSVIKKNKLSRIALPSFLCQSPLAAVLLADWEPVFCDVDIGTANVSLSEWERVIDLGVDAVLFVHLFGNVTNPEKIARKCHSKGIFFIEDAAQSLGGAWNGKSCGAFGDASLVSFGHTKIIDVGHGGMVLTNDPILAMEVRQFDFLNAVSNPDKSNISKKFLQNFYSARDQFICEPELGLSMFKGLINNYQSLVPSKWNDQMVESIIFKLDQLPILVNQRREKNQLYCNAFQGSALVPLDMSDESVPWRAVFRLPNISWFQQNYISTEVRKQSVNISNWYIPSDWLMKNKYDQTCTLNFTNQLSREIFQFWVDDETTLDELRRTSNIFSDVINRFYNSQKY